MENVIIKRPKYWIIELYFSDEYKKTLDELTSVYNLTYDELFNAAIRQVIDNPSEYAVMFQQCRERNEADQGIQHIREYPVFEGETEEEARDRALQQKNLK